MATKCDENQILHFYQFINVSHKDLVNITGPVGVRLSLKNWSTNLLPSCCHITELLLYLRAINREKLNSVLLVCFQKLHNMGYLPLFV